MAINNRPAPTAADKLVAAELVSTSYNEPTTAPTRLSIKDKLFRLKKVGNLQDQNDDENQFKVGKNSNFFEKGAFTNYVDKIMYITDHLSTYPLLTFAR
jgi:hypothetical protein